MDEDAVGATPLPVASAGSPVRVWFDEDAVLSTWQEAQAVQQSVFAATRLDDSINGSLVSTNRHFIVYVVKNGLLRILHRSSTSKALMRGHVGQRVTDIRFFNQDDVFGSVGGPEQPGGGRSSLIVSRVSMQPEGINVEMLLEFRSDMFCISRLVWHPFDMNVRS